jgi:hypothetical protein
MAPLKLTDEQLTAIMHAAQPLAVQDRDAFLREVAAALAALPERGDGTVYRVVREVQRRHFDPPSFREVGPQPRAFERARAKAG